jgi:rifampicin phosphotransferase
MADHGWLIDTVPSEQFPVYTRLNANDVLPDPITPLGASFCWIPHIIPGWAAGYVALDAFTPSEAGRPSTRPSSASTPRRTTSGRTTSTRSSAPRWGRARSGR